MNPIPRSVVEAAEAKADEAFQRHGRDFEAAHKDGRDCDARSAICLLDYELGKRDALRALLKPKGRG